MNKNETIPPTSSINVEFYANGNIKFIKKYNDKPAVTTFWFDSSGYLKSIQNTVDTIHDGQSVWFYPNGIIQNTIIFKNGKEDGNAFNYYQDGALQNHRFWSRGKKIGFSTNYYDDSIGLVESIYKYNDSGNLIGIKKAAFPGDHPKLIPSDSSDKH